MKSFMKVLELILKNFDKIVKGILKFVGKKQKKLEEDKRDDAS